MKRRAIPCLTADDEWIWYGVCVLFRPAADPEVILRALDADRVDAAIMLEMTVSGLIPVYEAAMSGGRHRRVVWWEFPR